MFLQKYKHRKVLERGDLQCIFIGKLGRIGQMEPGEWIGKMSLCLIAMK